MLQVNHFDPHERQLEKDRARQRDERDLREGRVSREELAARNGFLSPLQIIGSSIRHQGIIG